MGIRWLAARKNTRRSGGVRSVMRTVPGVAMRTVIGAALLESAVWAGAAMTAMAASAAEGDGQDYFACVTDANRVDNLLEKYGAVSAVYRYYFEDKTVSKQEVYRDREMYVDEMGNDLWVDEGGDVYGFDTEKKKPWRALFAGSAAYEDFQAAEVLNCWDQLEDMTQDGLVTCERTELGAAFSQEIEESDELNGYEMEPGDCLRYEFETDPDTWEITKYRRCLLQEGEPEVVLERADFIYGGERPQPDEKLKEQIFAEDGENRTVTLIADAGTDMEKTYRQTVGKGCSVDIYLGLEYDDRVYSDPECTKVYKAEEGDDERDATVYTCTL